MNAIDYRQLRLWCRTCGVFQFHSDKQVYNKPPKEFVPCPQCKQGKAEVLTSCRTVGDRMTAKLGEVIAITRWQERIGRFGYRIRKLKRPVASTGRPRKDAVPYIKRHYNLQEIEEL